MSLALFERDEALYSAWKRRGADRCLRWIEAENGFVPPGAIVVGHWGGRGGEPLYIGRMTLPNGDTIPGTIIPTRGACYAAWRGAELEAADYEVLVNSQPERCHLHWVTVRGDGSVPRDAVKGGLDTTNGELIYVARGRPPGFLGTHVCQVRANKVQAATVSFKGATFNISQFKVLCRKFVHPGLGVSYYLDDHPDANNKNINDLNNRPFSAFR